MAGKVILRSESGRFGPGSLPAPLRPEVSDWLGTYLETTAAGNPRLNITYTQNRTPRNRTARSVDGVGAELLTFTVVRPHRPNQCSANQHILHSVKLLILENKLPNRLDGP